jgi:hypothetical protein
MHNINVIHPHPAHPERSCAAAKSKDKTAWNPKIKNCQSTTINTLNLIEYRRGLGGPSVTLLLYQTQNLLNPHLKSSSASEVMNF